MALNPSVGSSNGILSFAFVASGCHAGVALASTIENVVFKDDDDVFFLLGSLLVFANPKDDARFEEDEEEINFDRRFPAKMAAPARLLLEHEQQLIYLYVRGLLRCFCALSLSFPRMIRLLCRAKERKEALSLSHTTHTLRARGRVAFIQFRVSEFVFGGGRRKVKKKKKKKKSHSEAPRIINARRTPQKREGGRLACAITEQREPQNARVII